MEYNYLLPFEGEHLFYNIKNKNEKVKTFLYFFSINKKIFTIFPISNHSNTIEIKQQAFKKLKYHAGNPPVDNISPEKIQAWLANQKISRTTTNIYLRAIKAMFNWAHRRNMIMMTPFLNAEIKPFEVAESDQEEHFSPGRCGVNTE